MIQRFTFLMDKDVECGCAMIPDSAGTYCAYDEVEAREKLWRGQHEELITAIYRSTDIENLPAVALAIKKLRLELGLEE